MDTRVRQRRIAYLAWIAVCFVWGTTYLAIRVALESIPVALLAELRWLVAGAILALIVPLLGQRLPPLVCRVTPPAVVYVLGPAGALTFTDFHGCHTTRRVSLPVRKPHE